MSETWIKDLEEKGGKTYRIELTCAELEFIRDVLIGLYQFEQFVNGNLRLCPNSKIEYERGLEQIRPDDLANKIFRQYHDGDGDFI